MARYNEKNVIDFLVSLSFGSLTVFMASRGGLVAEHFGCTLLTAGRWIDRAQRTNLIKSTSTGFVRTDAETEETRRKTIEAIDKGVESGTVVRIASVRAARLRKQYDDVKNNGVDNARN